MRKIGITNNYSVHCQHRTSTGYRIVVVALQVDYQDSADLSRICRWIRSQKLLSSLLSPCEEGAGKASCHAHRLLNVSGILARFDNSSFAAGYGNTATT